MDVNRAKVIAYNAIVFSQLEEQYSHERLLKELGMTEEEYKEIMED